MGALPSIRMRCVHTYAMYSGGGGAHRSTKVSDGVFGAGFYGFGGHRPAASEPHS